MPNSCSMDPESSLRGSIAPTGWTSSGLRAPRKTRMGRKPDGNCRDHWCSHCRKKPFSRVILVLVTMEIFLYHSTVDPRIVHVILAPEPCNSHRIEKKTCQIFPPIPTFSNCACQLRTRSCQILQILDVSSKNRGYAALLLQKKKYLHVILAQRPMQKFSAQNKTCSSSKCVFLLSCSLS